jgi:hypothetical protein
MTRKGLAQANTLRSNNTTSTGYGVAYADEVSGHRTVATLTDLYGLKDWQLSASGNNTGNDAIGQLWYVVDVDGKGAGDLYQLKDWENRNGSAGWQKFSAGETITVDDTLSEASTNPVENKAVATAIKDCVKKSEITSLSESDIDAIWGD